MKKVQLYILALLLLYGCGGSTPSDKGEGNPSKGVGVLNLSASKLGFSGGFVDVDGDGIEDMVVGAPHAERLSKLGVALVYKGNSSGGFSDSADITLSGDDNFGYSFLNLGDVDGDSKSDFAITAINGDGDDSSLCGAVYIYKGGSNGETIIKKLGGEGALDKFGISIASGDLNADGKKDIIVGAPFNFNTANPAVYSGGAVYVYLGPDFTSKISIYPTSTNKGLGWKVAAGDVNNDNVSDLLISATGKVLVYYGGASFSPSIDSPNATIKSSAADFGKAIALLGDIDSDGITEIAIGAPKATVGSNRDTGAIYIVKGNATGTVDVGATTAPADLLVTITGNALFDRFGSSIVPIGDIDNDSKPDFAVGAPIADVTTNDMSGKVYLFKGKDIGSTTTLTNSTVFNGNRKDQGYGLFFAPSSNSKLLIGAPWSHTNNGEVFMIDTTTGESVTGISDGGTNVGGDSGHQH